MGNHPMKRLADISGKGGFLTMRRVKTIMAKNRELINEVAQEMCVTMYDISLIIFEISNTRWVRKSLKKVEELDRKLEKIKQEHGITE